MICQSTSDQSEKHYYDFLTSVNDSWLVISHPAANNPGREIQKQFSLDTYVSLKAEVTQHSISIYDNVNRLLFSLKNIILIF